MGNGLNNPKRHQPGVGDIYGSLDTRGIGSRYADVEAITPNINLTPEGEEKTAKIFEDTKPPTDGNGPVDRQARFVEESRKAETIASTVDGSDPMAKARQDTFGAAEVVTSIGPDGMEITRTSADEHQLDGTQDDGDAKRDTTLPVETIGEREGMFRPDDGKDHTLLPGGPSNERDHPNDGESFPGADPAVRTPESLREAGKDDEAAKLEAEQAASKADTGTLVHHGEPFTDDLPEEWQAKTKAELTELAQARGVEIIPSDIKTAITTKLQAWQDEQNVKKSSSSTVADPA